MAQVQQVNEFFPRHRYPDDQVLRCIQKGMVKIWRKDRAGVVWFRINMPNDENHTHVEAAKNPKVRNRDKHFQERIEGGDWPDFLPSSAVGERQAKKLIATGRYVLWRIEGGTGCWWLKRVDDD